MPVKPDERWSQSMRADWDARARKDAEHFIYTRDSAADVADFDASGRANYDQLVRPFLPILLDGRDPAKCRAAEIGCGAGRMTQWFAESFGEVHGFDVSPEMIGLARSRLERYGNVRLHTVEGPSLKPLADDSVDLAFSYIVFQHVPAPEVVEAYVAEAYRVLRPGGHFKFQLCGDDSAEYRDHVPDTWLGVAYSDREARRMVERAGLATVGAEGAGSQMFVLTARKGELPDHGALRPYLLPGETWAGEQMLEGWGEPVDNSWRPVESRFRFRLAAPRQGPVRFYLGLYFWPEDEPREREIRVAAGVHEAVARVNAPGDQYCEFPMDLPDSIGNGVTITVGIEPAPGRRPAARVAGFYTPRDDD